MDVLHVSAADRLEAQMMQAFTAKAQRHQGGAKDAKKALCKPFAPSRLCGKAVKEE
jgi:hypothetical protein